jgi:serine/threonine-protein kinase HipA
MRSVEVWLSDIRGQDIQVGLLREVKPPGYSQASLDFSYESSYLENLDTYEISSDMPLFRGAQQLPLDRLMFSGIADSLPDDWGRRLIRHENVTQARLESRAPDPLDELEFLMRQSDDTRLGALRFKKVGSGTFEAKEKPALTPLDRIVDAAARFDRDAATEEDFSVLSGISSPLGGARPKVNWSEGAVSYIVKLWSENDRSLDIEAWEAVALSLAQDVGLLVPGFSHRRHSEHLSLLFLERFDRVRSRRIGYQSMRHAMGIAENNLKPSSYQEMAQFVAFHSVEPRADLEQLFKRAALSIALNDVDDHLKNFGFLRGKHGWKLAPAFDINPKPPELVDPSNMWITPHAPRTQPHNFEFLLEDFKTYELTADEAQRIVRDVVIKVQSWPQLADYFGISDNTQKRFASAFAQI